MYGFHLRVLKGPYVLGGEVGANSEVFAIGDAVTFDTDGFLIVATAGLRVLGFCNEVATMTSSNETVAAKKVSFVEPGMRDEFECDASAAITATNRSQYADLTGTTGIQQIDQGTVADNSATFRISALDPRQDASTVRLLVNVAEPEQLAYTQN